MHIFSQYERAFQGYHFEASSVNDEEMLLTVENESGRGTMCCYEALPGALLVYHDFKMGSCYQKVEPVRGFLQINHLSLIHIFSYTHLDVYKRQEYDHAVKKRNNILYTERFTAV